MKAKREHSKYIFLKQMKKKTKEGGLWGEKDD